MPWLIADSVLGEASRWLDADLPSEWADWLDARAERCFARHGQFHRLISAPNAGRDNLYKFMRHWLASRLARKRRRLYDRLPSGYALGHPPAARSITSLIPRHFSAASTTALPASDRR